jgi:anti-sigma factor (TIGR02949 family)
VTGPHDGDGAVDCSEALARLFAFLDAEIGEAEGDRIREHLAACEPCLTEYEVSDHLKKLVRRSCSEVAPTELHIRIRQQLTVLRMQVGQVE